MKPSPSQLAELLESRALGSETWIVIHGASLRPLVRPGHQLLVRRCEAAELCPGDLAAIAPSSGPLVVHLVVSCAPLRTARLGGADDPPGARALGRVLAIRGSRRSWALQPWMRWPVLLTHRSLAAARASPPLRTTARLARSAALSASRPLRRAWLGAPTLRPIAEPEWPDVWRLLSDLAPTEQERAQRAPLRAVGAFGRGGELLGVALVLPDGTRGPFVTPIARDVGLEDSLEQAAARPP